MLGKIAAGILLMIALTAFPASGAGPAAAGPLSADQILKEVDHRMKARDESARVVMTVGEADGATRSREIEIVRKSGKGEKVLVRLDTPADLRGTALLSVGAEGKEDQWLYLPSSKQIRRILGNGKGGSFLDSELSYEDLGVSPDRKFSSSVLRLEAGAGGRVAVIENRLKEGDSAYGRVLLWVPLASYLVSRIEYYDRAGKLLKVSELSNYASFASGGGPGGGKTWRARAVFVRNVQNHRTTRLELRKLAVNRGIDDGAFSVAALGDD